MTKQVRPKWRTPEPWQSETPRVPWVTVRESAGYHRCTSQSLIYLAGKEIGEKAGQAKDTVVHTAENAADKFGKGARDVKNTVADTAGNTADKLKKGAHDVQDNVAHAAGNAKDGLERGANNVKYVVNDAAGTAKKKVETGVENVKDGIGNSKFYLSLCWFGTQLKRIRSLFSGDKSEGHSKGYCRKDERHGWKCGKSDG